MPIDFKQTYKGLYEDFLPFCDKDKGNFLRKNDKLYQEPLNDKFQYVYKWLNQMSTLWLFDDSSPSLWFVLSYKILIKQGENGVFIYNDEELFAFPSKYGDLRQNIG